MAKGRGASRRKAQGAAARPQLRPLLSLLLLAALLAGLAAGGYWLSVPANLPIRTVRVENRLEHVDPERVKAVLLEFADQGIFHLDVEGVREAIEAMPWVASASVRRSWPDRVVVRIREHQAVARWGDEALLSRRGVVFTDERASTFTRLPRLSGPKGSEELVARKYSEMSKLLSPVGLSIAALTLTERRAWQLSMVEGFEVVVGRSELYPRLMRFSRYYPKALKALQGQIAVVDLRYTNGFAVRWRNDLEGRA